MPVYITQDGKANQEVLYLFRVCKKVIRTALMTLVVSFCCFSETSDVGDVVQILTNLPEILLILK